MVAGKFRRLTKSHPKAFKATSSTLRLIFKSSHAFEPVFVVVVSVDYLKSETFSVAGTFVLTLQILIKGIDIGIAIEDSRADTMLKHTLDYG